MIPGAHLARPHSIEPNPRAYAVIDQHADHYHWDNSQEYKKFLIPGSVDDHRGGGHAHSGVMIYLADQWPASYRDKLLTLNFHGRRVNIERLDRSGSGYVGRHEPDIFFAADPWFRGIDLSYGPDGSVFVVDWSDTGECHDHDGVHRSSGRIYRLTFGEPLAHRQSERRCRPCRRKARSRRGCTAIPTNGSSARPAVSWPSDRTPGRSR